MIDIPKVSGRKEPQPIQEDQVAKSALILSSHVAKPSKQVARANERYLGSYHSKNPYVDLTFGESDRDRFRSSQSSIRTSYD